MKVKAVRLGYYGDIRRKVDAEFELASADEISLNWMEPVDEEAKKAFKVKEEKHKKLLESLDAQTKRELERMAAPPAPKEVANPEPKTLSEAQKKHK